MNQSVTSKVMHLKDKLKLLNELKKKKKEKFPSVERAVLFGS